jgi:hypothetical protein
MPKEGELSRKTKMELKKIIKVNIVKATPKPRNKRETAKLVWSCEQDGCCKTYNSHSSMRMHVRETHEKSAHQCGCGAPFKRLEYLMTHQLRCNKRSVATQTWRIVGLCLFQYRHHSVPWIRRHALSPRNSWKSWRSDSSHGRYNRRWSNNQPRPPQKR